MKKFLKKVYNFIKKLLLPPVLQRVTIRKALFTLFCQKILGFNRGAYWPAHFTSRVTGAQNIRIGERTSPGFSRGCYIQGIGKIIIGDWVFIAPNVGIISANHCLEDINTHIPKEVVIGSYSWIGMNAVVLPGVILGEHTVVAAGSVVTKSFPEGYCVIAGNPAKKIKDIDPEKCVHEKNRIGYHGYLSEKAFRKRFDEEV